MSYQPAGVYEPSFFSIGTHDLRYTERFGSGGISTTTAWIANLAVFVPFTIDVPSTVYEWWWQNGTLTTAHNVDFGIYNLDFTKVQSLGSTVGGTSASAIINTSTWTNLDLSPGAYYMAFADDSTRNFTTSADIVGFNQACGMCEQTSSSFPLPSPATPVTYTRAFLPYFGMNLYTVAF